MHIRHAGLAFDGYMVGLTTLIWLAGTAWIMDHITASLYGAALAVIKTAAASGAGG